MADDLLSPVVVTATTIEDAWVQLIRACVDRGHIYTIDQGSYAGQRRKQLFSALARITHPGTRPLAPQLPPGCPFDPPTSDENIDNYFCEYIMNPVLLPNEEYRYSTWIVPQVEAAIAKFQKHGFGTNQCCISVGDTRCAELPDPPCLRLIDMKVVDGVLHFHVVFRSWDLFAGFPENLGGMELLKEYVAGEIGATSGEIIAYSGGLHLYDHFWPLADLLLGR
jgi:thymidylate synthase